MVFLSESVDGSNSERVSGSIDVGNAACQNPEFTTFLNDGSKPSLELLPHDTLDEGQSNLISIAPDGGWGWVCTFSGFWIQFLHVGIFIRSFGLLYLAIGRKFPEAQDSVKAWIPGLVLSLTLIMSPIVSILATIFSLRKVIFIGGIVTCIGVFSSAFVNSAEQLILTIGLLCGIGGSFTTTLVLVVAGRYFHKKRAIANGLCLLGTSAGAFSMPYILDFLLEEYSLRGTFIILGGFVLHMLPCAMLMRPVKWYLKYEEKPRTEDRLVKFSSLQNIEQNVDEIIAEDLQKSKYNNVSQGVKSELRKSRTNVDVKCIARLSVSKYLNLKLLKNAKFVTIVLANCCKSCSGPFVFQFLPSLAVSRGISIMQATVLLSVSAATECFGRVFIGWFIYKTGTKSWFISGLCMAISSLLIFILALVPIYQVTMTCIVFYGFFLGCQVSLVTNILVDDHGPENLVSAHGLMRAFIGISLLLPSPVLGWLKDTTGSYTLSYVAMSALLFLSFAFHMSHSIAARYDADKKEAQKYLPDQCS